MRRLIFGCGYLGHRVARLWCDRGDQVHVVTRSAARAADLAAEGFETTIADVRDAATLGAFPPVDTVLWSVGFDRAAGGTIDEVYVNGFRNALAALDPATRRVIYISSTGVYGDVDAGWVDEDSPCRPRRPGGIACLAAEEILAQSAWADHSVVLRLAGIYGPDRVPNRAALVAGEPIAAPTEGYLNLIHVDDAARVVLAAAEHPTPARCYTVSDGQPPRRRAYYEEAARLLGAPAPQFTAPPADSHAAARAASDKRVSNARMQKDFGVTLAYPSYREGLRAILS